MRETPTGKELAAQSEADGLIQSPTVRGKTENEPVTSSTFSLVRCFDVSAAADEVSLPWNPKYEIEKYLHLKIDRKDKYIIQSDDRIACVQIWIRHKGRFTTLCEAALRIIAI
jgi:hypothetical protein